ncbi:hypothetical protein FF1_026170 [Malus domestica]
MAIRYQFSKDGEDILEVKSWVFGLFTRLDSTANRSAPIVAVEARLRVRIPPRRTAAAVPTVRSCFGNMVGVVEFHSVDLSNCWRVLSELCEAKGKVIQVKWAVPDN